MSKPYTKSKTFNDIKFSSENIYVEYIDSVSFPERNPYILQNHKIRLHMTNSIINVWPIIKYYCTDFSESYLLFSNDNTIIGDIPPKTLNNRIHYTDLAINITKIPLLIPDKIPKKDLENIVFKLSTHNKTDHLTQITTNDISLISGKQIYKDIIPKDVSLFPLTYNTSIVVNNIIILSRDNIDSIKDSTSNIVNYLGAFRKVKLGWGFWKIHKNKNITLDDLVEKDKFDHVISVTIQAPQQPRDMLLNAIRFTKDYIKKIVFEDNRIILGKIKWPAMEYFIELCVMGYLIDKGTVAGNNKIIVENENRIFEFEIFAKGEKVNLQDTRSVMYNLFDNLETSIKKIPDVKNILTFESNKHIKSNDIYAKDKEEINDEL